MSNETNPLDLEFQGEDPIQFCHWEAVNEEVEESVGTDEELSYEDQWLNAFGVHCNYAHEFLNDETALQIKEEHPCVWELGAPWRELSDLYIKHGYPVYLSDTCGMEIGVFQGSCPINVF